MIGAIRRPTALSRVREVRGAFWEPADKLADLNRDVDFYIVWLPAVKERTDLMFADAECQPT